LVGFLWFHFRFGKAFPINARQNLVVVSIRFAQKTGSRHSIDRRPF
jgi:hypothetical protein